MVVDLYKGCSVMALLCLSLCLPFFQTRVCDVGVMSSWIYLKVDEELILIVDGFSAFYMYGGDMETKVGFIIIWISSRLDYVTLTFMYIFASRRNPKSVTERGAVKQCYVQRCVVKKCCLHEFVFYLKMQSGCILLHSRKKKRFFRNRGVMILASWLSQALIERANNCSLCRSPGQH